MVKVYPGVGDADVSGTVDGENAYNLVFVFLSPMSVILKMIKVHPGGGDTNVSHDIDGYTLMSVWLMLVAHT